MGHSSQYLNYPASLKEEFIKTPGLTFGNGSRVTAHEIWEFMTKEGPRRFPYAYDISQSNITRISDDVNFFSGIKRGYLTLTLKDRLIKAHADGVPIVLIQGGQSMDPYYAAGGIPLRPGFVMQWARDMEEGLELRETDLRGLSILESGRRKVSIEACNQIAAHAAIDDGVVPIDLIAPYLCLRCSDMAFLVETHRSRKKNIPRMLVDFPVNQAGKEWTVEYLASNLKRLVNEVEKIAGRTITDEDLYREIKLENKGRRLAREITELWWQAEIPPTNSNDFFGIPFLANDFVGDPLATIQVLEETKKEIEKRINNRIRGYGLADKPKRIFICGSCVGPNPTHLEKAGAVLVGRDDNWSSISSLVDEEGDPYENLARAILAFPYEQATEQRAEWTVEQIRNSKADGVIFMYNWGCNYQTGIARLMADIIKKKTGVPTTFIEVGELGRSEALEQSENRIEAFIEMLG